MNSRAALRRSLKSNLHGALDKAELRLHYQPQFNLASARIVGAEALIRWTSPEQGLIAPDQSLPIAEQTDLSMTIGRWVLTEDCRRSLAWQASGLGPLPISINVSAAQFRHPALANNVRDTLQANGADPDASIIVDMAIGLGKTLGHRVVACGVEAAEQMSLRQAGACDTAQGYYLSYPLCANDFALLLARKHWPLSDENGVR